jgi:hypothetical protein
MLRVRLVLAPVHLTNFGLANFLALDLAALILPTIWRKSALAPTERSRLANFLEPNQAAAKGHGRANYLVRLAPAANQTYPK